MNQDATTWAQLEADQSGASGLVTRQIETGACCDVFLAVKKPENYRMLLLEVPASAIRPDVAFPRSRGIEVTSTPLSPGPRGKVRITLRHTQSVNPDIFLTVVSDVASHVGRASTQVAAVDTLIARLAAWQRFLEKYSQDGLSDDAQEGLFGELWFLQKYLIGELGAEPAVRAWTGPRGTNQDFELPNVAVEVKTSRANPHQKMHISNVRQLDATGVVDLLVFHLSVDVRQGGDLTLVDLVERLRGELTPNPLALADFDDRLLDVGYLDAHSAKYRETSYTRRDHHFFSVVDDFPRIVESDLCEGVGDVRYTVAIAACMAYQLEEKAAVDRLGAPTDV